MVRLVLVVVALLCSSVQHCALAQFTDVYPARMTSVTIDHVGTLYFTHATDSFITAVVLSTGLQMSYDIMTSTPAAWPSQPSGLAADAHGSLWIADGANNRIVRMNVTTGHQTAVYTTSSPALSGPTGLALDRAGCLLVCDTLNHRIVKLDASTGVQVAEYTTSSPSLRWPTGVAVDSTGQHVFVSDTGNSRIVKLDIATGQQRAVYNSDWPLLSRPRGLVMDAADALYIADSGNNRVVKLSSSGIRLAIYTTSNVSLDRPCGVAVEAGGALYVADLGNDRVVQLVPELLVSSFGTSTPSLRLPRAVTTDAIGSVVIVDSGNQRIVTLNSTGAEKSAFYTSYTLTSVYGIAVEASGAVLVPDTTNRRVVRHNLSTGAVLNSYTTSNPALNVPSSLALGSSGDLYIADSGNQRIVKLNSTDGRQLAVYPTRGFSNPPTYLSVAVDAAGNIYIATSINSTNSSALKLSPDGEVLVRYYPSYPSPSGSTLINIAIDWNSNDVYVCASGDFRRVVKFNNSGAQTAVYMVSSLYFSPVSAHVDAATGALYATDWVNSYIVRFDLQHGRVEAASFKPCYPLLYNPYDVAVDGEGSVYASDRLDNRILKVNPAHAVVTVYTTTPSLNEPWGVAVSAVSNYLFIADAGNNRVVKLSANGVQVREFVSPPGLRGPMYLALDGSGRYVFVSDTLNNRIVKLNATTGEQLAIFATSNPLLDRPHGIAVTAGGDLIIADFGQARVVRLSSSGDQLAVYTIHPSSRTHLDLFGLAVGSDDAIYAADALAGRVVKLNATGHQVDVFITSESSTQTAMPRGVTVDLADSLFIADSGRRRITKLNSTGGIVLEAIPFQHRAQMASPRGMALTPGGNLIVANADLGQAVEFSPLGQQFRTYSTSPTMPMLVDVAVDGDGNLYLVNAETDGRIVKLNSTGTEVAIYNTTAPSLRRPYAVAVDKAGSVIYIGDWLNDRVVKLSSSNVLLAVYKLDDMDAVALALDALGEFLYVCDVYNDRVLKLDSNLSLIATFESSGPPSFISLHLPRGVAADSAGLSLYVSLSNSRVVKLNSTTGKLVDLYLASSQLLRSTAGVAVNAAGDLYVSDVGNNQIVRFVNPYCPAGYYCPFIKPILCPKRYYCPPQHINAVTTPTITPCPFGHYCPIGTAAPLLCPAAHYCPPMSAEPVPCPAAYYCYAGSVDPRGSHMNCSTIGCSGIRTKGHYCPYMTASPIPCPEFVYGDEEGLVAPTCSGHCSPGTYWNTPGQQTANCSGVCELGQYCPINATQPLPCPGGSYCPTTTALLSCKPGYYGASMGLTTETCTGACDAGFICTENSITPRQLPCPPGQYNNATGQSVCVECAPGTYAEASVNGTLACTLCPAGTSSSVHGSSRCVACSPGSYAPDQGYATCAQCPAGQYSQLDSSDEADGIVQCLDCPIGQYSPTDGSSSCQYCSIGHYNNRTGQQNCALCPPGTAAADEAESRTSCTPCPLGEFSVSGKCEPCPRSTYSLLESAQQCLSCSGIAGVDCEGGIAYIDKAYHGAVQVRMLAGDDLEVSLTTQRCPDGYCVGVNSSMFNAVALSAYLQNSNDHVRPSAAVRVASAVQRQPRPVCGLATVWRLSAGLCATRCGIASTRAVCRALVPASRKVMMLIATSWALVLAVLRGVQRLPRPDQLLVVLSSDHRHHGVVAVVAHCMGAHVRLQLPSRSCRPCASVRCRLKRSTPYRC